MRSVGCNFFGLLCGILGFTIPADCLAADAGWGVQFYHDTFAERTFPVAMMAEKTEGFSVDPTRMFLLCHDGGVRVAVQPERLFFEKNSKVNFKGSQGVVTIDFDLDDVDGVGAQLVASEQASGQVIKIFSESDSLIPFQLSRKQGSMPAIGFEKVLSILREQCGN